MEPSLASNRMACNSETSTILERHSAVVSNIKNNSSRAKPA